MTLRGKPVALAAIVLCPLGVYILPYGHIRMLHICSVARHWIRMATGYGSGEDCNQEPRTANQERHFRKGMDCFANQEGNPKILIV